MKALFIPFGSHKVGESRDQDFVAFPHNGAPEELTPGAVEVDAAGWSQDELAQAAQAAGISNPDIWAFNQEGDMKPIIVANLVKDYPGAAERLQQVMGLHVKIQGGDPNLMEAMEANVLRWNSAPPHLPNLRKCVFSRIQRDAYAQGLGFFNTKSEIAKAAARLGIAAAYQVRAFLLGDDMDPDAGSLRELLGLSEQVSTYQSQHGCVMGLPELARCGQDRTYLTPVGKVDGGKIVVLWEEVYTSQSYYGTVELEPEVWAMLLEVDLEEIQ